MSFFVLIILCCVFWLWKSSFLFTFWNVRIWLNCDDEEFRSCWLRMEKLDEWMAEFYSFKLKKYYFVGDFLLLIYYKQNHAAMFFCFGWSQNLLSKYVSWSLFEACFSHWIRILYCKLNGVAVFFEEIGNLRHLHLFSWWHECRKWKLDTIWYGH